MERIKTIFRYMLKEYYRIQIIVDCWIWSLFGYTTMIGFWGIGDCCYELVYLDEYKKKYSKKIRVIAYKKKTNVFSFYDSIDKISVVGEKKARYLAKYGDYYSKNKNFILFIGHYRFSGNFPKKMLSAYKLENSDSITYPIVCHKEVDVVANSILVNLNSHCFKSNIIESFIIQLINYALQKEIYVYINSPVPNDYKDMSGVEEVFWDLEYFYNAVQKVKCVISIRTGLLDFIANSKANIICLYDKTEYGKRLFDVFNLNSWQKNSDCIHQFFVEDVLPSQIVADYCLGDKNPE